MSFNVPTGRKMAYHGAGHAYAFAAPEHPDAPFETFLGVEHDGGTLGGSARRTLLEPEPPFASLSDEGRLAAERAAAKEAIIALAGPMAHNQFSRCNLFVGFMELHDSAHVITRPESFDDDDLRRIRETIAYVGSSDPLESMRGVCGAADTIVHANRRQIDMLARELDRKGSGTARMVLVPSGEALHGASIGTMTTDGSGRGRGRLSRRSRAGEPKTMKDRRPVRTACRTPDRRQEGAQEAEP